jgi:hypothetical protein
MPLLMKSQIGALFMPLPLGHLAIGWSTHSLFSRKTHTYDRLKTLIFVTILSNLPDIDVLIGLISQGNGNAFHRGPTHSILFALFMGYLASSMHKLWSKIPRFTFRICFLIILSHTMADYIFTDSPVSFFWPFEMNFTMGYSGWHNVIHSFFWDAFQDTGIIVGCVMILLLYKLITFIRTKTHRQIDVSALIPRDFSPALGTVEVFDEGHRIEDPYPSLEPLRPKRSILSGR